MTLPRQWQKHALVLLERARPLEREYFRSVELSYAHPDDVINGEGTRLYGGRFVRPGVRAVYGSAEEQTAIREAVARKERLAGAPRIPMADYPRITYVIAVKLAVHIDLTAGDLTCRACCRPVSVKTWAILRKSVSSGGSTAVKASFTRPPFPDWAALTWPCFGMSRHHRKSYLSIETESSKSFGVYPAGFRREMGRGDDGRESDAQRLGQDALPWQNGGAKDSRKRSMKAPHPEALGGLINEISIRGGRAYF